MTEPMYWARRSFGYMGAALSRGQIFALRGSMNDEKLLRLGYAQELAKGGEVYTCAICGAAFVDIGSRSGHGKDAHSPAPVFTSSREEEVYEARRESALELQAPLYLENTKASQESAHLVTTVASSESAEAKLARKLAKKEAKRSAKKARKLALISEAAPQEVAVPV